MTPQPAFVVEDDLNLANIYASALSSAGYEVQIFHTGRDALAALDANTPQLITLDLHLPRITGPDILLHIRSHPELSDIQVIITTADPLLADLYKDLAAFVLVKPISYIQLQQLAKRLIASNPSIL